MMPQINATGKKDPILRQTILKSSQISKTQSQHEYESNQSELELEKSKNFDLISVLEGEISGPERERSNQPNQ